MTKKKKGKMPIWKDYEERIEVPPWKEDIPWGMPIQLSLSGVVQGQQGQTEAKESRDTTTKEPACEPKRDARASADAVKKEEKKEKALTPDEIAKKLKKENKLKVKRRMAAGRLKSKCVEIPNGVTIPRSSSELIVITKAKDLVAYIFLITKNSPRIFRPTFIARLQNLGLDVIQDLYFANECLISKTDLTQYEKRKRYQAKAKMDLKMLEYFALLAYEAECIQSKHYEQIAKLSTRCHILLANWVTSDAKRVS